MVVVWFTGLPASGKTTLAKRVRDRLSQRFSCVLLDSDEIRDVFGEHSYEPYSREAFYSTLGRMAALLARQNHVVLVAATAPRCTHRERARAAAPDFVEVYVRTPIEECVARDPKGLYALAQIGGAEDLPGVGGQYEEPLAPDVVAEGGFDDAAAAAVERLVSSREVTASRNLGSGTRPW